MAVSLPTLFEERELWQAGALLVAGVDEVGLGCLAGPIVSAAVVIPIDCPLIPNVRDSKTLSLGQRTKLFKLIQNQAIAIGIGIASVEEIDRINILQASHLAMSRALARVEPYDHALIDGRAIKPGGPIRPPYKTIIHGDAISYAIACASIIAKVRRDRLMEKLAKRHPGYGWETNAGYGTKKHLEGLDRFGVTPWHRRSYAPVREVIDRQSKPSP
jgi:ribonuclease HII